MKRLFPALARDTLNLNPNGCAVVGKRNAVQSHVSGKLFASVGGGAS